MAHDIINQIDLVKEKLTDAEYKRICDSLAAIHVAKHPWIRFRYVHRAIMPQIEGKVIVLNHYCRICTSQCITSTEVDEHICNDELFNRIVDGGELHPDTAASIKKCVSDNGIALLRSHRNGAAHIQCPCTSQQTDETLAIFSCQAIDRR